MNFLSVTSDVQTLELACTRYPNLSGQCLSFSECTDVSLGLVETTSLKAVLTARPEFVRLEHTTITLRNLELENLAGRKSLVRLEPLQQMNLRFEKSHAVIDDMPRRLPEDTPYYALVQHLMMGRLEHILAEMDVFYLEVNSANIAESLAEVLSLRSYQYSQGMYSKYLLMTNTVNVMP
jgi:hypothetical protein